LSGRGRTPEDVPLDTNRAAGKDEEEPARLRCHVSQFSDGCLPKSDPEAAVLKHLINSQGRPVAYAHEGDKVFLYDGVARGGQRPRP
jgi:hypothetical protein